MNLQARKINLIQEVLNISDSHFFSRLEDFFKTEKSKIKEELSPMSLDEFYQIIDKSLQNSKEGKVISNTDLKKEIKGWH